MTPLTVNDVYRVLGQLIAQGMGDKIVAVTDDDEGNGYHFLWYEATTNPKEIRNLTRGSWAHLGDCTEDEMILIG